MPDPASTSSEQAIVVNVQPSNLPQSVTIQVPATIVQAPPPPPPPPAPPYPRMTLGTNVAANDPWSPCGMWCDTAKQATGWYPAGGTASINYDANGYPSGPGTAMSHYWLYAYPTGTYHAHWDGPQANFSISGKKLTPVAEGSGWGADVQFNSGDYVQFQIVNGGVSNVHLYAPDAMAGQTFRNAYLAALKRYKIIRLMPLARVNGNGPWPTAWGSRTLPSAWDQTSHELALEYQLELCREAGSVPWLNLYYGQDDDSITKTAQLVATYGFPLVAVEYQNELWNFGSGYQGNLIRKDAAAGTYGSTDPNVAGARRAAGLAAHAGSIFRGVLGASKVKVVFGGQATWNAWAQNGLAYVLSGSFDVLAVAPYFQPADTFATTPTVAQVLASCVKWIDTILGPGIVANAQVAQKSGCELWAYEGGQSLLPVMAGPPSVLFQATAAQVAAFNADPMTLAQSDPGMAAVYDHLFSVCRGAGMTSFCHFMAISSWGRSGYWGLQSLAGETPNAKARAVASWIAAQN